MVPKFLSAFITCALLAASQSILAECVTDKMGSVHCSKFAGGGAVINDMGEAVCGKGECLKDSMNHVLCSKEEGGGAGRNSMGNIKCLNGCEPASQSMCVKGE